MGNEDISMEEVLKSIEEVRGEIGEIVKGKVIDKHEDGIVVDFGGKFEGFVPTRELIRDKEDYEVGEELELLLYRIDEDEGRAYLSERRPKIREALDKVQKAFESDRIINGKIVGKVKGGYRVLIDGVLDAFLPGSQSLIKRDGEIPQEELEFEIIDFERRGRRHNLILSRRTLLEKRIEEFFKNIKEGDEVEGTVESIKDFGVFVKLADGVTGLLPRSEISYTRVASIEDMFSVGDKVRLKVIAVDPENKKITLSLKAMLPDPFEEFKKDYGVGDRVSGEVVRITQDGAIVRLPHEITGFIPIEEIFWGRRGRIRDVFKEGDRVEGEIIEIDDEKRRVILSYKRAKGDPWDKVEEKYPVGSEHEGRVVKVLDTGAIVELEDGVAGFVPLSELSWHYFDKPSDVVRERRKVKVKVLDINKPEKRMRLSIKQTQKNPWERVVQELDRGSIVKGRVRKVLKSGYVVRIRNYNVDAFLPSAHVEEELKPGSDVEAVVLRILDNNIMGKKMIISVKDLEEMKTVREYSKEAKSVQKSLGSILKEKLKGE